MPQPAGGAPQPAVAALVPLQPRAAVNDSAGGISQSASTPSDAFQFAGSTHIPIIDVDFKNGMWWYHTRAEGHVLQAYMERGMELERERLAARQSSEKNQRAGISRQ